MALRAGLIKDSSMVSNGVCFRLGVSLQPYCETYSLFPEHFTPVKNKSNLT